MDAYGIDITLFMPEPHGVDNAPSCNFGHLGEIVENFPARFAMLLGGETLNVMIQRVVTEPDTYTYEAIKDEFQARALEILATGAVGFGEMAAEHFSLASNHPYVSAPPDHPLFKDLADIAALYDVPIDLHMEALTSDLKFADLPDCSTLYKQSQLNYGSHFNDPDVFPENITAFKTLLDYNPNAKIIWVHAGWDNTNER
ncbi:MAG: hypothetical protein HYT78_05905, partial [Deltaproteobacteria bacterium]|nr:hypothetical protein [Deltaproteobacteria bacterium]